MNSGSRGPRRSLRHESAFGKPVEQLSKLRQFQDKLINRCQNDAREKPLSQAVVDAFYAVPRHKFIAKYRDTDNDSWIEVNDRNFEEHLPAIYGDAPLIIHGSREDF